MIEIRKVTSGKFTGEYIVELKNDDSRRIVLEQLGMTKATHEWNIKEHGFAGLGDKFDHHPDRDSLAILQRSPEVTAITQDTRLEPQILVHQTGIESWGLARLSRTNPLEADAQAAGYNNHTYSYNNDVTHGGIVDIYILDDGINAAHVFGNPSRVQQRQDYSIPVEPELDDTKHGTWVASIAGSTTYGVTKHASYKLIDVKVSPGGWAHVINGLAYVRNRYAASNPRHPSVVNFSVGPPVINAPDGHNLHYRPVHIGFTMTTRAGIHVVTAAGNDRHDVDAMVDCPSHIPSVITVGATGPNDGILSDDLTIFRRSNFGESVDVFAPGADIIGAAHDNNAGTFRGSGTSIAAPHVSGLVAYLLMTEGPRTAAQMKARIRELADQNTPVGLTEEAEGAGTTNRLAYNGAN